MLLTNQKTINYENLYQFRRKPPLLDLRVQRYTESAKKKYKRVSLTKHLHKNHHFSENFSTYHKI